MTYSTAGQTPAPSLSSSPLLAHLALGLEHVVALDAPGVPLNAQQISDLIDRGR